MNNNQKKKPQKTMISYDEWVDRPSKYQHFFFFITCLLYLLFFIHITTLNFTVFLTKI